MTQAIRAVDSNDLTPAGFRKPDSPEESMANTFRHTAGFGKRIEYWIIGRMLKEGLDVYLPLVDDDAIDAVIRRPDQTFTTVQIKARSRDCIIGDAGLFSAIPHELRDNYWFVFYSERMDQMWIMTSAEFIANSHQNKEGKNKGKRGIWFNGRKKNKLTGEISVHCKPQFLKYVAADFQRLIAPADRPSDGREEEPELRARIVCGEANQHEDAGVADALRVR